MSIDLRKTHVRVVKPSLSTIVKGRRQQLVFMDKTLHNMQLEMLKMYGETPAHEDEFAFLQDVYLNVIGLRTMLNRLKRDGVLLPPRKLDPDYR